ncbi:PTS sugar transporter subunit IIA [Lactobacillus melliventris]|uniref:PTS sugar transporter subunit IIA n=1 Tax=Lactobacillus melliventris TaxID=1218507 RepID=UPI00164F472F|nr:PTS glucose transporter subunit IIA [Lactobacillus melliventris]MBC6349784.1 PTS glucose transporter subunit IIA [Lactobacillus melliventris]
MFNIFKKRGFTVTAACDGKLMPITDVKDEVFSQKMLGDGYAIKPTDGKIYSPVAGTVTTVFPTKHAIGITTDNNLEILVHLGIDTVELKGEPFEVAVKQGDTVKQDDYLASMNTELITAENYDDTVIVVYTNMDVIKSVSDVSADDTTHGDTVQTLQFNA